MTECTSGILIQVVIIVDIFVLQPTSSSKHKGVTVGEVGKRNQLLSSNVSQAWFTTRDDKTILQNSGMAIMDLYAVLILHSLYYVHSFVHGLCVTLTFSTGCLDMSTSCGP